MVLSNETKIFIYSIPGIIFLIAACVVWFFLSGGVKFTIYNVSSTPINGVVVHVTGNSYPVGDIPTGSFKKVKVVSKGESHIEIEHKGIQERLIVDCYFEQGYRGNILVEITPDRVVNVESKIEI